MGNDIPSAPREWRVRAEPAFAEGSLTCKSCGLSQRVTLPPPTLKGDGHFQHWCPCGAVHPLISKRLARECEELREIASLLPEAPDGNPGGRFPPEKYAALAAVLAAAKPFNPGEVAICVDGRETSVSRADALIWALGKLDTHAQLNHLADSEQVPNKLSRRFHAIAAAAHALLKKLGADQNAARFGVPEQIREGLKLFAEQEATERGGFRNHPPEIDSAIFDGEEIKRREFHEDRQFQDNIEGIFQIRSWARQAKALAKRQQKGGGYEPAYAVMEKGPEFEICDEIFEIWEKVLGKRISATVDPIDGTPSGPLIDFTHRCLELLGQITPSTDHAIRERIRRHLHKANHQKF